MQWKRLTSGLLHILPGIGPTRERGLDAESRAALEFGEFVPVDRDGDRRARPRTE